jgi:hypothetical protein
VRLDGPVTDARLDDGEFIAWPTVEAQIVALDDDGPPITPRIRVRNATILHIREWTDRMQTSLEQPVRLELSPPGRDAAELRVTYYSNQILDDDDPDCVQIEVTDDGRRRAFRLHQRKPLSNVYAMFTAQDAELAMLVSANLAMTSLPPEAPDELECDDRAPCDSTLDRTLDRIFRIGVPCGKAFVYVHPKMEWPSIEATLLAATELGIEEVTLGPLTSP